MKSVKSNLTAFLALPRLCMLQARPAQCRFSSLIITKQCGSRPEEEVVKEHNLGDFEIPLGNTNKPDKPTNFIFFFFSSYSP